MKIAITILALYGMLTACASVGDVSKDSDEPTDATIYTKLLADFVTDDSSETGFYLRQSMAALPPAEEFPELHKILQDFPIREENDRHQVDDWKIKPITSIPEEDLQTLFADGCEQGWIQFRERFPESRLLLGMSAVYYSEARDSCAVYFEMSSGCVQGMGNLALFSKVEHSWEVQDIHYVWGGY